MKLCRAKIKENGKDFGRKTKEETKAQNAEQKKRASEDKCKRAMALLTTQGYSVVPPWAKGSPLPCTWEDTEAAKQVEQEDWYGATWSASSYKDWPASVAEWRAPLWHAEAPAEL